MKPRIYDVEIRHVRADPVRHEVRHRGSLWYVDLDELPRGFPRSLRASVDAYLREHGIDLDGGRITMLANRRSIGYVFNPLTVFWCHDRSGRLACVVAEVHNTYGGRHRYLLQAADAVVEKAFYVSPFHPVDGHYELSLPEPGERLRLTVTLHRPGARPFVATVRGVPARRARAFEPWRVRAGITRHGIALWRAGLPVQPRPKDHAMTTADRLATLVREIAGIGPPVRLRAWDGTEAGPADGPAYIAPDMHMRPMSHTVRHLEDAGFEVRGVEAMREHYVRTVTAWIDTLEARWDEFAALQGEQVARVWRLYLVGGALAFEQGRMGVDQYLAVAP